MPLMSKKRHKIKESELQGFKYFKAISGMLERLHQAGCQRDRAGRAYGDHSTQFGSSEMGESDG